ncbi:MAG: alpha amylase C-terminal domain-containing protein [Flavobacteriaceae bacterium]|jgi:1,4-alpha-glucan branching enzyme|nr:alpha amylase C-terminal domain-containing protein [Flavobacteriaceae bacterium]
MDLSVFNDPELEKYRPIIIHRYKKFEAKLTELVPNSNLSEFSNGYLYYGLHACPDKWIIREWAPNARKIFLVGDFNNWQKQKKYEFYPTSHGNWEIELPLTCLKHEMLYKLWIEWEDGGGERIPAYCRRVVQDPISKIFSAQVWNPLREYEWKYKSPKQPANPLIYEAHIGMAGEKEEVSTYNHFREKILPYIAKMGYNTVQFMAIQEHPYYGSFGYQVSNFFAPSSRFGTPEELKELIDTAHKLNICVVLDIVHSHSVKNENDGLSRFDGSFNLYFHPGEKGMHSVWNSRLFDYGKNEVIAFLLSNCKYWMEEFRFDGFRFDGVTSMMYHDHGIGKDFTDYSLYYDGNQDEDAITYLTLANKLIHELNPDAFTIAEDVSGMPGLASPIEEKGIGFDYRMAMGIADFWVKLLETRHDEEWHVGDMFYELTNKRKEEKTLSYAESHDQAMVGDKTLIFRLIDSLMYTDMNVFQRNAKVDRGLALHKMIRLATVATAGNGYLTFMGNEFGHPEWIDFPREGNNWSYAYARRQWNLLKDTSLRYRFLAKFEQAFLKVIKKYSIFNHRPFAIIQSTEDQVLIFKRNPLLFVFNFNPVKSFTDYGFEIDKGTYKIILNSDDPKFDGFDLVDTQFEYPTHLIKGKNILKIYIPSRTAMVLWKRRE